MKKLMMILMITLIPLSGIIYSDSMSQWYIRCYVEILSSDPMGNTDLTQYEPEAVKHIDVLVIEYSDTDWNNYYTKGYDEALADWQNAIDNLNTVFSDAKIEFSLKEDNYRRKTIQTGAGPDDLDYLFTDCNINPLNDIKSYPDYYFKIATMPLEVKVRYNETDYTVQGSVDKIFGSAIYVERGALGYDLQYYTAQSLGLYDTDETHFGEDTNDFLDDTEINEPDNLMNRQNGGDGLTTQQIQRLNWALETRPDLIKLIETEVEFANKINSETITGNLFYDSNTVPSGNAEKLLDSKLYEIGTQDQIINHNSKEHQHYMWNDQPDDYLIKRNTRIIKSGDKEVKQHAQFSPLETINIDMPSETDFYLRDPWFLSNGEQPNSFREIDANSFEALLDQNEDFQDQYPIYEIKQPESHERTVHNEQITYYFQKRRVRV